MNLEQAAEQLGCSVKTVRRRIDDGSLPAARIARGVWLITDQDLAALAEATRVTPRPAAPIEPVPVVPRSAARRRRAARGGDGRLTVPPRDRRAA